MNNFWRALRVSLRYRLTLAGSLICAVVVAGLWGGNISAIYPIVEVVFKGQGLPAWVDEQVRTGSETVAEVQSNLDRLQAEASSARGDRRRQLAREQSIAEMRLDAEKSALARNLWLQPYFHRYLPTEPFDTLLAIMGLFLAATFIKDLFLIGSMIFVARLAELTTFDLRTEFYRNILNLDLISFGENARGDIMNRFTNDMRSLNEGIQTVYGRAVREPLKMVACLIGAAIVCWRLLFFSLIIVPLMIWLARRLARSLKRANRRAMEEMSQIYHALSETLAGIKVVKAFTMERYEMRRFHQTARLYYHRAMKIACYDALIRPLTELTGVTVILLAILAGGYLALNGETHLFGIRMSERPLTLASLLLFYGLLAGASDPARKLSDVFNRLQQASAAGDRIYELLDRASRVVDAPQPVRVDRHHQNLEFRNVSFSYRPNQPVLKDVSLRIEFGETIAIVGPNGCGKSTLSNLVPRFFDPVQGSVLLDGVDVREIGLRDLRKQIGLVAQETLLFDDSVANNIRYGKPSADRRQVIQAAEAAHAHRFIETSLAEGYDAHVGPGGNRLSGGQRQRIAIARAILRDPSILILDEATSQIDLESEQLIHQVLEKFIKNRTTLIITHRLSTLALADRILVMDEGEILDLGAHDELLVRCEFYRRLHHVDWKASA